MTIPKAYHFQPPVNVREDYEKEVMQQEDAWLLLGVFQDKV